ncbi:glycosyltransferase [Acidaminococcus provencensis]|uniref:glycosyltransferase n=1 Tax=Acidaminococcus provencensis TaxID=2058289 RepID=UPI000CF9C131|nr:glycosyltransferase [Acidaminococcus provencensis]
MKKLEDRVLVLLSTYNGSKYLCDLLDSVFHQTDVEIFCLVRDDGSTDNTKKILKEYSRRYKNISIIEGKNIGVMASFNELISNPLTKQFKWLAFCDQDDVWLPEKLNVALKRLNALSNQECPLLYCSNTILVDEHLKKIGMFYYKPFEFNKHTAIVRNIATGCTEVFNQAAAEAYRTGIGRFNELHDYWMYLVCIFMGNVIYDFNSHILYRQHNGNVVGMKPHKNVKQAIKNLFSHERGNRVRTLKNFSEIYHSKLSAKDLSLISSLINYNYSLYRRLSIVFNPKLHGITFSETIGFKIRALLGRLY